MSGSYQQLLQKYNQLLALVLNLPAGGGTLQSVITANDELQGSPPALDQVIKYDGTNVVWATDAGSDTLQSVITANDELQGSPPTLNQVIKYDGTNVVWSAETQTLDQVLTEGNTTTQSAIFQVGTSGATIDNNGIAIIDIPSDKGSSMTKQVINLVNITTLNGIFIDNSLSTPYINLIETGIKSELFTDKLDFTRATGIPPVSNTVGISITATNGLELTTNGTLTLDGLGGSDGQYLKQNSLGNAVWDSLPTVKASSVVIGASDTTGTIPFGFTFTSAPTVTISQVTSGNIIALSIASTTTTGFTWKSTSPGVGNINWIATL